MPTRIPRRYRSAVEALTGGHQLSLLHNGTEAFPAMLDAIDAARRQVLLEMYWFDSDHVGRRFANALERARARGVEVAVIYDSLGSMEADGAMFDELRDGGVRVLEFNPIMPWHQRFKLERVSMRDHRKILVVDGRVGFTGGINLAAAWAPSEDGGQGFRDDMVRIEGPAVADLIGCFRESWEKQCGAPPELRAPEPGSGPAGAMHAEVLGHQIRKRRREIVRAYLFRMYRATRRIWLANSYFLPDGRILRALVLASLRGVDVRVLLPGRSDVEVVRIASRAIYERLLRVGVRIFEWQHDVLHSKTAVIDGEWSTIGSFNLDYRSLRSNLEVNVSVLDSGFAALMEASFDRDLALSTEVTMSDFEARPLPGRVLEQVLYRFRSLL